MKEIVRQVVKIRVWALAALAVFSCVFGAQADTYYFKWETTTDGLRSSYESPTKTLKNHPVYLMATNSTVLDYAARNALYGDMAAGITVATVKYRVFSSDTPGGKAAASDVITYTGSETAEMSLPDTGVKYYMLDAELDTVQ